MKLSTLEIKGFKSFADKTVLHFNENITGVVGPNGCGKSNVVDAIRWVLGEQKPTALRTERMENLIFNGTKNRKSSGMAEVSLTFENTRNLLATEFSTVTVSRHYFKTGESEYRINGVTCRLKDIQSLFMDTGISTDSYSIIELGMLDDILHDKDNSRRKLFEQAAGISKYKSRKKETLNKLGATQLDLDRVEDLLFEIENNLKELEKQAKRAQRYQKLKGEYKLNSIDLAVLTLQSHKDIYKQLSNQQTFESDAKLSIEAEIDALEASIADKKTALIDKEQSLSKLQKDLNAVVNEIHQKENDTNLSKERTKFLEEKQVSLQKSIEDAEQYIASTQGDIASLEQRVAEENEKLVGIKQSLQHFLESLEKVKQDHDQVREKLESTQSVFKQAERELYDIDKKIAINKVRLENYNRELGNIESDRGTQGDKLDPLRQELVAHDENRAAAQQTVDALMKEDQDLKQTIAALQREIEKSRNEVGNARRKLDAKKNEFTLTKNMFESFEGFPESIKYLKKNVASMKESPLLSDVVSSQDAYKTAIESFLDPWLNYYIVQDMAHAMEAVNELATKEKGRANFFLLSEFKSKQQPAAISGVVPALDVVTINEKYAALASHLLGNVYIIAADEDFAAVSARIASAHPDVHLLHQSGRVARSGKAISGGSVGLFKGKRIGREKTLETLEAEIKTLQEEETLQSNALKEQQTKLSELQQSAVDRQIQQAREELNKVVQQQVSTKARIESIEQLLQQMEDKKVAFMRQIQETDEESIKLNESHDKHMELKEKRQAELLDMEVLYREVAEKLTFHSNQYNQENIKYHQQFNRLQSVQQDLDYKRTRRDEAMITAESSKKQLQDVTEEIAENIEKVAVMQEALLKLYDEKTTMEQMVSREEENYYGSRGEVAETEDKIKALQKKKDSSEHALGSIKDRLNELKVQLAGIKERLWVEFQVELESILDNEPPTDVTLEELQVKVDAAKKRIENYGEVNPMAIQAYEEMNTRYDFIKTQREDLLQAKTSLLDTIKEIDETARNKFDEAFMQIRENFKMVFRSLFNEEDDCDLLLKDDYDPLEAQIEIIAKPKGKKPQVIDQLSGGEKTLTGMSLLFALYLIKPAPFCILDEVDAPLDDNNIMKFNNTIRKFADKSQFIIVTHNKRTMSEVDIIYGVTMPEMGISKVVPVDFRGLN
ncbi:MAG TPA: chromosome segregation protein SMC [Chitinophagales bacterium]|nr:chromosome segregation protein SMC [Chitinophagales bacterium]HMZ89389.1 chromosome segregation protein SMC [Chitinophagales bacterium]HNF69273.1 chromosome segregation protein SMC [Chitinophagales bacterium]HNI54431.1 chromosome segregation protein SMC [Chitinophagales bacterium]HNM09090.1 chromosome segregation protein SMC [Chitinophagales bacterium]